MPAVRTRRILDTAGVDAVMAAAEQAALENGYRVVIAVVDASGRLLGLRRTEDAQAASDQVAIDKARTAAIFVRPSREIEEQVNGGPPRRPGPARRPSPDRRHPAGRGRRGRGCGRHQRRDHR